MINAFIVVATLLISFFAFNWKGEGWGNILMKLLCVLVAVMGAICSAAVLGVTP